MLIESALITYLLTQTGITSKTSERVYLAAAPQDTVTPYLVVSKISGVREQSHETNTHLAHPRFQFTAFAARYSDAKNLIAALQTALQGYTGTMGGAGGVVVSGCFYDNETDLDRDGDTGLYGVEADYLIWHYE